eukprot:scaffold3884_cov392-Prasinococcus_capsulatus_cf.AAC.21
MHVLSPTHRLLPYVHSPGGAVVAPSLTTLSRPSFTHSLVHSSAPPSLPARPLPRPLEAAPVLRPGAHPHGPPSHACRCTPQDRRVHTRGSLEGRRWRGAELSGPAEAGPAPGSPPMRV